VITRPALVTNLGGIAVDEPSAHLEPNDQPPAAGSARECIAVSVGWLILATAESRAFL
jgi:hypothetical protein